MPLREISNNSRSFLRGKGVDNISQKQARRVHTNLPLKTSVWTNPPVIPDALNSNAIDQFSVADQVCQSPLGTEANEVASVNSEIGAKRVFIPSNNFLHSVDQWCMFVSRNTENWALNPYFKQEDTCHLCLLCGKSVRGPEMNDSTLQKHVKGSHHKKTYQLMENLKTLKERDAVRFDDLTNTITLKEFLPNSYCTLKQLLAYYHNITLQALHSKKPLDGITKHFKLRFLSDKIKSETRVKTENGGYQSHTDGSTYMSMEPSAVNDADANGNEENQFGVIFRSPVGTVKEPSRPSDTPFIGKQTKHMNATVAENSKEELPNLPPTKKTEERSSFESPSSDISVYSELQWMRTIDELDDILENNYNMFDGSLDEDLQKMVYNDDEEDISMMRMPILTEMPIMVVTPLDNVEEAHEWFETEIFSVFGIASNDAIEQPVEHSLSDSIEANKIACRTAEAATDATPRASEIVPLENASSNGSACASISDTIEAADAKSQLPTQHRIEVKRSLDCIAALAFVNV